MMKRITTILTLLCLSGLTALAQETEGHGGEDPNLMWKWANFALLAIGLGYLLMKNIPPYFKTRSQEIQEGILEARQIKADAEKRASEIEARTRSLGADIEKFRTESRAEMEQEGARIRQETANQIARLQQQAAQEVESASKVAQRELKEHAAKLALDLAEQRLRGHADSGALIDGFIQDLTKQTPAGKGARN